MTTTTLRAPGSTTLARKLTLVQGVALALVIAALFLSINHQAYGSFFHDDSFDNMGWTNLVGMDVFRDGLLTWKFSPNNFRPVGHYYFRVMHQLAGYNFAAWLAALHLFHLAGVWLLWLIIRRLGAPPRAAAAGLLFFAVHMAAFWAYWRPMYDFDVLCGLFTLLCLYLYMRGNLLASLLSFWLAYKAKEMAVAIPAILFAYEWFFGGRRWWRVLPFAAISASFVTQAYLHNKTVDNPYSLRLTPAAFWTCVKFYSKHVFFFNYSGFLLLLLPLVSRDKRVWFGLWTALCLMGPMLFLPGRLFDTYLYLPAAGLALAFAFAFERTPKWVPAAFAVVWMGANVYILQRKAPHELEVANKTHTYFDQVFEMAHRHPYVQLVTYRGAPPELAGYGIDAIFRQALNNPNTKVYWAEAPQAAEASGAGNVAITLWDHENGKLIYTTRKANAPYVSRFGFASVPPAWQLGEGWYVPDSEGYCWTKPRAKAWFLLPKQPSEFHVRLKIADGQVPQGKELRLSVNAGGVDLPVRVFKEAGAAVATWTIGNAEYARMSKAADSSGNISIWLDTNPPFEQKNGETRMVGAAIEEIGFR
jgi:hypothetical protein